MTLLAFSFEPPLFNLSTYKHRHLASVFFRAFFSVASSCALVLQPGEYRGVRVAAICISRLPQSPVGRAQPGYFRLCSSLGLTPITWAGHA